MARQPRLGPPPARRGVWDSLSDMPGPPASAAAQLCGRGWAPLAPELRVPAAATVAMTRRVRAAARSGTVLAVSDSGRCQWVGTVTAARPGHRRRRPGGSVLSEI